MWSYTNNLIVIVIKFYCKKRQITTYPALKIIGGRRYMKKRSSLKAKISDLVPPLVNRITTPVHRPCHQQTENMRKNKKQSNIKCKDRIDTQRIRPTIKRAVMDSFIHRIFSKRCPTTIHAQMSATKQFMDTTEL